MHCQACLHAPRKLASQSSKCSKFHLPAHLNSRWQPMSWQLFGPSHRSPPAERSEQKTMCSTDTKYCGNCFLLKSCITRTQWSKSTRDPFVRQQHESQHFLKRVDLHVRVYHVGNRKERCTFVSKVATRTSSYPCEAWPMMLLNYQRRIPNGYDQGTYRLLPFGHADFTHFTFTSSLVQAPPSSG